MVPAATSGTSPLMGVTWPASVLTKAPDGPTPTTDPLGCFLTSPAPFGNSILSTAMSCGPSRSGSAFSSDSMPLPVFALAYNSRDAAITPRSTSGPNSSGMDPDTAAGLLATGECASRAVVGTLPRGLFSPEATLMLIRGVPAAGRTEAASKVVSSLLAKIVSSRGSRIRATAIETIRALMIHFCAAPVHQPRFGMTRSEYHSLAHCWGRASPCLSRVGSSSSHPETHDYVRFRQWHLHTYCGVAGDTVAVDWKSASDVLIRKFCSAVAFIAVREAGRAGFPPELVEMIARHVASPHRAVFPFGGA